MVYTPQHNVDIKRALTGVVSPHGLPTRFTPLFPDKLSKLEFRAA